LELAILFATSLFAGFVGAMMGVGGGIILVPVLTSLLSVPIRVAIGASMFAVVATSSAASAVYVREKLTNLSLGVLFSGLTVLGALLGVLAGITSPSAVIYLVFSFVLLCAAWLMFRRHKGRASPVGSGGFLEQSLRLSGAFEDAATGEIVEYGVRRIPLGALGMVLAGLISGMLGIGGGIFQVPVMDAVMGIPIKAATATSNFMMGITAATGAIAYLVMGYVHPEIAGPVVVGVFLGSGLGARVMPHVRDSRLRFLFIGMLVILAVVMARKGVSS